jgi:hypothetical protein
MKKIMFTRSHAWWLPVLLMGLSGCGAAKDEPKALMGPGGVFQNTTEADLKRIPVNAALLDGRLSVPSDLDILDLGENLSEKKFPFSQGQGVNEASSSDGLERPYITFKDSEMNTGSNLLFRAIHQIPPKASIRKVKKFQLTLSGLNRYQSGDERGELLEGQVLCFLSGKTCFGTKPKTGISQDFWKGAKILPGDWLKASDFKSEEPLDGGGKLISSPGEQVVDFLRLLKGDPAIHAGATESADTAAADTAAIVEFIYRHSEAYSEEENGYRKFRFVVGDRLYLSSGKLELDFETGSALPADFAQRPGLPKKGALDQVYSRDQLKPKLSTEESTEKSTEKSTEESVKESVEESTDGGSQSASGA